MKIFFSIFRFRSQFVQALLLSTLSLIDDRGENDDEEQNVADSQSPCECGDDDILNNVSSNTSCDSITPTVPQRDYDEAKKKQESASSEFDSHLPNAQPQPQQRSSTKPKTSGSKSQNSPASQQSGKSAREKASVLPSDTR